MSQARTPEIRLVEVDRLVPFEGNPRKCGRLWICGTDYRVGRS